MRSILYTLLSLATVAVTVAAPVSEPQDDDVDEKVPDTTFNGQTVPPMIELGTDLNEKTKTGHWYEFSHDSSIKLWVELT